MPRKLTTILTAVIFLLITNNFAFSQNSKIIPIKKPILTDDEIQKKIILNILKPLPKPSLKEKTKVVEKKTKDKKSLKSKYLLPKKKQ